jgi:YidC/Oxa1 family membrane protein insertase
VWTGLVELVRASIFVAAHLVGGSLGAAVVLVSAGVRLALLPLTLRAARHARAQQLEIAALRPQIERLETRYKSDKVRLLIETRALYQKHGIQPTGRAGFISALVQMPLLGALFSAVRNGLGAGVRFLWIGNLARADSLLLLLVTALAGLAASVTPVSPGSPATPKIFALLAAGLTLLFLWSASSAVALSVGAGTAVSALQNWIILRDEKT